MNRAARLLVIIAACTASAFAIAQAQQAPVETDASEPAPEAAAAPVAEAASRAPARYNDLRRVTPITGNVQAGQAKSEVCVACHGPQGISIAPIFPNLAGQRADFMYWQMVEFKRNSESPMAPLVADLSDEDMRDLSVYYAGLKPPMPEAGANAVAVDTALAERGEQIYLTGNPAKGIPPCQGCHGPDATGHVDPLRADRNGHTPYAAYPALRGQQVAYLETKLAEYRDGKLHDATTDFVMRGIGERLDDDSIQAVSAWLSSLPPVQD